MNSSDIMEHLTRVAPFLSIPVHWTDLEARLAGANQACLSMWKVKRNDDARGRRPEELYSGELADSVLEQISLVIRSRTMQVSEEAYFDPVSGEPRYYTAVRSPLIDADGNVVGVFGAAIDITAEKEAERQKRDKGSDEQLAALGSRVVHALTAPLTALKMLGPLLKELPEQQRLAINTAIRGIDDVVGNLQKKLNPKPLSIQAQSEQPDAHLLSGLVTRFVCEQQRYFQNRQVTIQAAIADNARFAFIQIQPGALKTAMAQLVKNAVDAVKAKDGGCVTVRLETKADAVVVSVQDNGKGMNFEVLTSMLEGQNFRDGKECDAGMQQVWDMLEKNKGNLNVDTILGEGTSMQLIFPRIEVAGWIAQRIRFAADSIIVVLDADESMHRLWVARLDIYLKLYPALQLHQFRQAQQALDFIRRHRGQKLSRLALLCAYELPHQTMNGIQIVELAKIKNATLVTAQYDDPAVQKAAASSGVKILPKEMVEIIPVYFDSEAHP